MLILFCIGYLLIAFEHYIGINKAATALLMGVLCWVILVTKLDSNIIHQALHNNLAEIASILFFLLGAMTVVELIDAHDGFDIITEKIKTKKASSLLWIVAALAFFLSAILDNLTTTIVMISVLRKVVEEPKIRVYLAGIIVIASNAGGVWSPIGDVTTTMLWIGGQITEQHIFKNLLLPSIVCVLVPLGISHFALKNTIITTPIKSLDAMHTCLPRKQQLLILIAGICILIFVPVFKIITHLPPFMGMLLGLGLLWLLTEILHGKKDEEDKNLLTVLYALRKIDTPSILFFLGILLSIGAMQAGGLLQNLSSQLTYIMPNSSWQVFSLGLLSCIVDNVPLVAATQAMYSLQQYAPDHFFWHYLTYCTGTGGSILIIGSAAGVAAMGMEKIDFFKYLFSVGWMALLGYIAGAIVCLYWI
jgi:Na+/H+ antiporter NhaD/arsenite permease-like protein